MEPKIDSIYEGLPFGQGLGMVLEVRRDNVGRWTHVRLRYAAGCMPVPPEGQPNAPLRHWKLPEATVWLERAEWERLDQKRAKRVAIVAVARKLTTRITVVLKRRSLCR